MTKEKLILAVGCVSIAFIVLLLVIVLAIFEPDLLVTLISTIISAILLLSIGLIFLWMFYRSYCLYRDKQKFAAEQQAKGLVKYKGRWGTPAELEKWREYDRYISSPTITEVKCTCNQCGKIWHYLPKDEAEVSVARLHNINKGCVQSTACCGSPAGCLAAAIPEKQVRDLNQCPNCKSRDIQKERITYKKDEKTSS